jgi:hypothetical protein
MDVALVSWGRIRSQELIGKHIDRLYAWEWWMDLQELMSYLDNVFTNDWMVKRLQLRGRLGRKRRFDFRSPGTMVEGEG